MSDAARRQESSVIAATAATPAATAAAATSAATAAAINFKIFRLCVDVRPVSNSLTRKLTATL